jgi:rod shape determining protein RodA
MTAAIFFRRLDYVLVAAVAGVIALGSVTILSVTSDQTERRQLIYVGIGIVFGLLIATVDLKLYRKVLWPGYAALLLLLMVVLGLEAARGSSRWIALPGFNLQPSEIGKVVVIVVLAAIVAEQSREEQGTWRMFGLSLLVMIVPCGLVFLEPDLGTAIVYGFAWLSILVVAGARLLQIGAVLAVIAAAVLLVFNVLPASGIRLLQPYQQQRITSFLDPSGSSEAAYQSQQAKIAIGSGGLAGKGETGATVSKAGFLPERHTDFIFAVVGEQRGFLGAALLLSLYVLIVWRAARAITLAATLYESLIAAGIFGMWIVQIFVNIGMTLGIMPTTGIPLPFMTYGGSNTITNLVACGLLIAIQVRGGVPEAPPLADHAVVRSRSRFTAATGD